jgi:glycosyltransferase involved in cell wall biosynthesis
MLAPATVTPPRTLLHIFPTFSVGGAQMRFVQLANHFGRLYRHRIVSLSGSEEAMGRLLPDVDAEMIRAGTQKGATLGNFRTIRRTLAHVHPDLLVTSNWGSIEWAMANLTLGVPHLHMEDGFGPEEATRQLPRRVWMRRLALSRSTVMLPSLKLLGLAHDVWKLPAHRLRYVPNGVDCARFAQSPDWEFAAKHGIRSDVPIIGAVGGLRVEKNPHRLLEAFSLVTAKGPAQLVIVGDGPLMRVLKESAEARGLSGHIVFTGSSPTPERFLPLFSVFALSSDTEQMPLSILEAMAASRAVAATDVGDISAMLAEQNRPFVTPRDARALSAAILALLEDPKKAGAIGRANRTRALGVYDQDKMFAAHRMLLDGEPANEAKAS